MIHIVKATGGYMVVNIAKNRQVLSTSEVIKTKEGVWKNIVAQKRYGFTAIDYPKKLFRYIYVIAQDDTKANPIVMKKIGNKKPKPYVECKPEKKYNPKK